MIEMLEALVTGLLQVFSWPAFGLMLVGITVGFAVGILPGLGGPTTLALMLPFIFTMTPVQAFAFLLGMAAVTATTGDITSILFGVPGEGTAAATIVDGHPMAKKGEAGRALGAALMSSLVGAVFGAFALALAIPLVRPLVLSVGSPEMFMLALLGISLIASLTRGAGLKGFIAGGMGLVLATVGLDPITGVGRYTYGQLFLLDGVGLLPVTLGLFAFPETIDLSVKGTSIAQRQVGRLGGVLEGVRDTFRHWGLVIRCSAIGTYIGIIPGMGGSVSQWAAYAHAVQSSPGKERFGAGAVEGVLGPGAANNSTLGGALVPTLAFGVPGSVSMAILLGAFTIQGLVPGPPMLTPEGQGGHLTLTFSLVWIIVVSNLIAVAVCFLFLNHLAKITRVRGGLLIPFILSLIYLGAFTEKNASADLLVAVLFGALGWLMVQCDWPRPPLLLGLVLGPLAENRLFLSTESYGLAWLGRPGVLLLLLVMLTGIAYPLVRERRRAKAAGERPRQAPARGGDREGAGRPRFPWTTLFSLLVAVGFAAALWESRGFGYRTGLFPWVIGFPSLVLATVHLAAELRRPAGRGRPARRAEVGPAPPAGPVARRTAHIAAWILGFLVAIWLLGFTLGIPLAIFLYLKLAARERWPITALLTAVAFGFLYGVLRRTLHVPFPDGLLL